MSGELKKPMFKRIFFAFLVLSGAVLSAPPPAAAQNVQTLDRLLPQIRRAYPGQMSDAEGPFTDANGQTHYRIKWVTPDGRVIWIDADARTGRVLGQGSDERSSPPGPNGRDDVFENDGNGGFGARNNSPPGQARGRSGN